MTTDPNRSNPHCVNCGDERGGSYGHEISECTYVRPAHEIDRIRRNMAEAMERARWHLR